MKKKFFSKLVFVHPKLFVLLAFIISVSCIYMKMNPPADADKVSLAGNNSCWLATASNMLAGVGYGDGNTVQTRSDDIYSDLTDPANFGTANGGWADTALTWWLSSTYNTWPNNPYTVVTVYGNKTKVPWANSNGAQDIGNELRTCNMVGVSISWPPDATHANAFGGHAITGWGDHSGNVSNLSVNPVRVRLTDSDREDDGDVQNYRYDTYTNPNPSGNNVGNGWYIDYSTNHPFIKHIVTLAPADNPTGQSPVQKVLGSYKIHQNQRIKATDLHYSVGTDVEILSYRTWISWPFGDVPSVAEADPRRSITVDWDFPERPIPFCTWITISTEFILPRWNAISYNDVHFTYPESGLIAKIPKIAWKLDTPRIKNPTKIPNVSGGYVVGSFDIIDPSKPEDENVVGQYRFIHEYSFDQSPETHNFTLVGDQGYYITNLNFGHSYGYIVDKALWEFRDWMTRELEKKYKLGDEPIKISLDWTKRLPYPEGEIVPWSKDPKLIDIYKKKGKLIATKKHPLS